MNHFYDIGQILSLVYTAALLGHIFYKGFIKETMDEYLKTGIA
jgi:hypothetical protein